jgi:hypothetical protein
MVPQEHPLRVMIKRLGSAGLLASLLLLLLFFYTSCSVMPVKRIDTTQDYRALGYPDQRKIARDSKGNLYVAYRKHFRVNQKNLYHIFVAKSNDQGKNWQILNLGQPIEQIGDFMQRVPSLAIDTNDIIHVAWYGQDSRYSGENERQIKYTRSLDGGLSWQAWQNVAPIDGYQGESLWQEHPSLAVNGRQVYITWQGLDPSNTKASQVRIVRSDDSGATWQAAVLVQAGERGNRSRPSLNISRDGQRLWLVAYGGVGVPQQIVWSESRDRGQSWSTWQAVAPSPNDQRHVSAALDAQGQLHIVWREALGPELAQIRYSVLDENGAYPPSTIRPNNLNQSFPSLAVGLAGTVWVVWSETEESIKLPDDDPQGGKIALMRLRNGLWEAIDLRFEQTGANLYPSLRPTDAFQPGPVELVWLQADPPQNQQALNLLYSVIASN